MRLREQLAQRGRDSGDRSGVDRLLRRTAWQGGAPVAALAVTGLLLALGATAMPAVLGKAVDAVIDNGSGGWLIALGVLIAVLVACDALDDLATGAVAARSTAWLRTTFVAHVLTVGTRSQSKFTTGELVTRLVGNSAEAGRVAVDVVRGVTEILPAIGGTVALALIDVRLCLTFLAGMPVLVLLLRTFSRDVTDVSQTYLATQGRIAARLADAVAGSRTIAAAGTAAREARRVLAPLPELHRHGRGLWRAQRRISAQDALLVPLIELAVLAVAGALLARGSITPGEMLAAGQYVFLAVNLGAAITFLARLARARAAAGRVSEILDQAPPRYGSDRLPRGHGEIELRNVTVRNGERPVLANVGLTITGGSLVAVVGRSGAGKSVLAVLLGRLLDPDEGEVLIDGVAVSRLSRRELRREVGYAFGRPVLMGRTVGDAIAFGDGRPAPTEIVGAARAARADDFIRRMPAGYRTPLADAPLSGGEVQRVGLARTFAHAGRVMIFDDVAASLDTVTEHHISEAITGAFADRTRVVVAHRVSTAAKADTVVWLDGGRVRAVAPHQQLWTDPDYRALFEADGERRPWGDT